MVQDMSDHPYSLALHVNIVNAADLVAPMWSGMVLYHRVALRLPLWIMSIICQLVLKNVRLEMLNVPGLVSIRD